MLSIFHSSWPTPPATAAGRAPLLLQTPHLAPLLLHRRDLARLDVALHLDALDVLLLGEVLPQLGRVVSPEAPPGVFHLVALLVRRVWATAGSSRGIDSGAPWRSDSSRRRSPSSQAAAPSSARDWPRSASSGAWRGRATATAGTGCRSRRARCRRRRGRGCPDASARLRCPDSVPAPG